MSVLRGTLLPRVLLAILGALSLALCWGSLESIISYGASPQSLIMVVYSLGIAMICLFVAAGLHPDILR